MKVTTVESYHNCASMTVAGLEVFSFFYEAFVSTSALKLPFFFDWGPKRLMLGGFTIFQFPKQLAMVAFVGAQQRWCSRTTSPLGLKNTFCGSLDSHPWFLFSI